MPFLTVYISESLKSELKQCPKLKKSVIVQKALKKAMSQMKGGEKSCS